MKRILQSLAMMLALLEPMATHAAYVQLAEGVYQDGSTLYICSGVTSLGGLQLNPSEIYCYATIPPSLSPNTFTGYNATLHVPKTAMVSYFSALYWYNFNNITADAVEPHSVTVSKTSANIEVGGSLMLSATVEPSNATPSIIYWSSTNSSVATVRGGLVTAISAGECDIIASCMGLQDVCHLMVTSQSVTITLDQHEARLLPNHTMTLTATCTPVTPDLVVTTSNPAVAIPRYVNGTIMVVGVGEGTATITVTTTDGLANPDVCEVTVYTELGDANTDGFIDIDDVTALIARVLGSEPTPFKRDNADVNSDGSLDIEDVTKLISCILNGSWSGGISQTEVIFVPNDPAGSQSQVSTADEMAKGGITVSSTYAALAANQYRFGKNSVTTFKSMVGKIVKIRFICTNDNPAKGFGTNEGMTYDDPNGTWEGIPNTEVVITTKDKQVRATKIIVTISSNGIGLGELIRINDDIEVTMEYNATVLMQSGRWLYVMDETGYGLAYGNTDKSYASGDIIPAGYGGVKTTWAGEPEIKNLKGFQDPIGNIGGLEQLKKDARVTTCYEVDHPIWGQFVLLKQVTVGPADPANGPFTGSFTDVTGSCLFYDMFGVAAPADVSKSYDVYGIVYSHGNAPNTVYQILPIEYVGGFLNTY